MTKSASDACKVVSCSEMAPTLVVLSRLQEFLNDPPGTTVPSSPFPDDARWGGGMEVRVPSGALINAHTISALYFKPSWWHLSLKLFLLCLQITPETVHLRRIKAQN